MPKPSNKTDQLKKRPAPARGPVPGRVKNNKPFPPSLLVQKYSGPLPPPEELKKYGEIVKNGAERIFAQFERQTNHRQNMEETKTRATIRLDNRSLTLSFILALLGIGFAGFLVYMDRFGYGVTVFLLEFLGIAGIFIYSQKAKKDKELKMAEVAEIIKKSTQ